MDELKTKVNDASVDEFLSSIIDVTKREDSYTLLNLMRETSNCEPKMWGASIIGFGSYHYVGKSGREGDWFMIGLSPRKQNLTLYTLGGWDHNIELLAALGKHTLGKGCLYIKRLSDINFTVLAKLVKASFSHGEKLVREGAVILSEKS
jgi:hypothetical protein